ncbi:uncharacterized protein METZ01_LOCUS482354 [marine metagenome]|uniref:Uncharacterized protein n=1 Tax=marine metagenome TaxID=408172 RepID=A0A383CBM5_9ZZZZ
MALIVVNLTDTFNEWREKTNSSIAQIGDLATLTASNSASIVGALNGMLEEVKDDLTPQLGGPLDVNDKAIVSAVGTNKNITITPDGTGKTIITKGTYSGELGADLVLNSNDITGTGNINFTGVLTATSIAGTVTGTTQSASNNSTKLATTAYVDAQVATENTLEEMDDTTIAGLADLNILQYDLGTTSWKNRTMTAAGIPTTGFTVAMAIALG